MKFLIYIIIENVLYPKITHTYTQSFRTAAWVSSNSKALKINFTQKICRFTSFSLIVYTVLTGLHLQEKRYMILHSQNISNINLELIEPNATCFPEDKDLNNA